MNLSSLTCSTSLLPSYSFPNFEAHNVQWNVLAGLYIVRLLYSQKTWKSICLVIITSTWWLVWHKNIWTVGQLLVDNVKDQDSRALSLMVVAYFAHDNDTCFLFTQGDIITSLQSRLAIICDEVDADKDVSNDVHRDANEMTSEQHVSQLFLHSLRYVGTMVHKRIDTMINQKCFH